MIGQSELSSPEEFYGFKPGTDRELVRWDKIVEYFRHLDAASDRVQVIEVGKTTRGNPIILAYVSSPANLERLGEIREMSCSLSHPRGLSGEQVDGLVARAHQLRDEFRSEWQRSGADPRVAELLLGHVVDPNDYLKFTEEYILEQYEQAEPRLSYVSTPDLDVVPISELERLRRENKELRTTMQTDMEALLDRIKRLERAQE